MADEMQQDLTGLTVDLLSAFVSNNNVRSDDLPGLIASTHAALSALGVGGVDSPELPTEDFKPAVTARKSLGSRDHIVSMIDGKPYRSLKRHLSSKGLTPEEYRSRYNLPANYPMVAPGYSDERREVAKRLGLGRKPRIAPEPSAAAAAELAPAIETAVKAPRKARKTTDDAPSATAAKPDRKPREKKNDAAAGKPD